MIKVQVHYKFKTISTYFFEVLAQNNTSKVIKSLNNLLLASMLLKAAMASLTLLVEEVASGVFLVLPEVELRLSEDTESMEDAMLELELLLAAPDVILGGGGIAVDAVTVEVDG